MKFKLELDSMNAAFDTGDGGVGEVGNILRIVAAMIEQGQDHGSLMDPNGNTVGSFWLDTEIDHIP